MNQTKSLRSAALFFLKAAIWGAAFVAQSAGMDYIGPFTFGGLRTLLGAVVLVPVAWAMHRGGKPVPWKKTLIGGAVSGVVFFAATSLQQVGIQYTTAGKAGFITALYIVIVPIAGIFLRKKAPRMIWLSVALAVVGLYFLCIQESFSITEGDWYVLLGSFCFAAHILVIDHFTQKVDGVELSCVQFLVMTLLSAAAMLALETPSWAAIQMCLGPILYVGIFSSGVAYTLQILAQKDSNPTVVALLLSLESVFATVAGALILGDRMSGQEYFGCVLMLLAVVLAQLPDRRRLPDRKGT